MKWRAMVLAGAVMAGAVVRAQEASSQPATQALSTTSTMSITPTTTPAHAGGFLSEGELTELFRGGKYSEVLHETGRMLKSRALGGIDEFHLQLMRAECYLQLRNAKLAIQTFYIAEHVAQDQGKRYLMRATAMVVERSTGLKYLAKNTDENGDPPHQGVHPPERHEAVTIDLLDMGKRMAALKAMYTDQWFVTKGLVEGARRSTTMGGYDKALKNLDDLAVMEEAVVGKEEGTQKLRDEAAGEMAATMENALADMREKVEKLDEAAKEQIVSQTRTVYVGSDKVIHNMQRGLPRTRGLTEDDARWLEKVRRTSGEAVFWTGSYAERLKVKEAVFKKAKADAESLKQLVGDVLTKNPVYIESAGG